jgi:hypothetical protein
MCVFGILLAGVVIFLNIGCREDEPGPISVINNVVPTRINSGDSFLWTIQVINDGGEVEIENIHVLEECIAGSNQGQSFEYDLGAYDKYDTIIASHESEVIYSKTGQIYNVGPLDNDNRITATVYSNGGTASDTANYTVKHSLY